MPKVTKLRMILSLFNSVPVSAAETEQLHRQVLKNKAFGIVGVKSTISQSLGNRAYL